jgi:hypothetical protein
MNLDEYYSFRHDLVQALTRDILGPSEDEEVISDPPITRYAAGVLYPQSSGTINDEQNIDIVDDDDVTYDPPVALTNVRYPASMGMTFAVDPKVGTIVLTVTAARYVAVPISVADQTPTPSSRQRSIGSASTTRWRRRPVVAAPVTLDVSLVREGYVALDAHGSSTAEDVAGLQLFFRVRPIGTDGAIPITVALINTKTATGFAERDADSFFQPSITASAHDYVEGAFVERPDIVGNSSDRDLQSYRLLYRSACAFAVGHGCSVNWDIVGGRANRATRISTTFVPSHEVPVADSNPDIDARCLEMRYLVEANRTAIIEDLVSLCDGYGDWIAERRIESTSLPKDLSPIGDDHLADCNSALLRMRRGVAVLADDDSAWTAFVLMNTAMLQQRARTVWLRAGKPTSEPKLGDEHRWRPFQLAFILLCISGIVDPKSDDRRLADLLWFPTGGGKTEAYLGLIAFTVFLRRLRNADGGGVTALMRYTLRLLTIQQFERATLMMCCLEALRRTRSDLGQEPISIGLWVGQGATPNTLDAARTALNKLRTGLTPTSGDPCQLRSCPWCGHELDHRNYYIISDKSRLVVSCRQSDCLFNDGLPVYVVDEDVYRYRPTLIIATADKFASIAWREQTAELFNLQTARRPAQLPVDLIIQDELHLISGPLGTLVGLYETAIDILTSRQGIGPKIVASTATIRRASAQGKGLFNREVRQFPPPGLDAHDSYFAVEAPGDRRGTRMYVGLIAPGSSHTTLLVRAYAALLQNAHDIPASDAVKDPYWTLVGYFNSLRVLGGARMQVQDDVDDRMRLLVQGDTNRKRPADDVIELTSREPSGNIPEHLKRMAISLGASSSPVDVILATNMISVGVDVDRLGLMAVMGQPQSTSEYIQATSRVGRRYPGLVVVLFNAARSRDRSHYESFVAYHSALYRQVESTSVTPFSARARDRALHAVLITLARMLFADLRQNNSAAAVQTYRTELESVADRIVARVAAIAPDEVTHTAAQLRAILDAWEQRVVQASPLVYSDFRNLAQSLLVDAAYVGPDRDDLFATLWSLRDVDQESNLFLIQ